MYCILIQIPIKNSRSPILYSITLLSCTVWFSVSLGTTGLTSFSCIRHFLMLDLFLNWVLTIGLVSRLSLHTILALIYLHRILNPWKIHLLWMVVVSWIFCNSSWNHAFRHPVLCWILFWFQSLQFCWVISNFMLIIQN